jgi:plastocyanin
MFRVPHMLRTASALLIVATPLAQSATAGDEPGATVRMTVDKKFLPAKVTIRVGQTVEWIADDPGHQHSITTDPSKVKDHSLAQVPRGAKPFTFRLIDPGKSFRYRFTVPGTYKYVCPPHEEANMVGEVVVTQ